MAASLIRIAEECLKNPRRASFWVPEEGRFICPETAGDSPAGTRAAGEPSARAGSKIDPKFKLVFLTAAAGTVLFIALCVSLHLATDGKPPPLMEKLIQGMFDLAKIGFGAIVGLLGGQSLASED